MIKYRPYQSELVDAIHEAWQEHDVVMAVQATRTGKTVVFAGILAEAQGAGCAIAHRQELVSQMSVALARCKVAHRIIAPENVIARIVKRQVKETGSSFYQPGATRAVASVDTLISKMGTGVDGDFYVHRLVDGSLVEYGPKRAGQWGIGRSVDYERTDALSGKKPPKSADHRTYEWAQRVDTWVVDEGHHVIADNKWGRAIDMFPNARGLLVTATACRADGKGLGRHADGVADTMVVGLQMREAINEGWLLEYRIFCPEGDFVRPDQSDIGANGDFKQGAVTKAVRRSHIVGDVVKNYQKIAPGKSAIVYVSDVQTATDMARDFNAVGIPAAVVSAKTPDAERSSIMVKNHNGELKVLINVDLFGEGVDLPNVDVVIMARPIESLGLYAQQFNRASTIHLPGGVPETKAERLVAIAASDKPYAIIIDHVGNVIRFKGPPDAAHNQEWSLDARDRKSRGIPDDVIPLRNCLNPTCMQVYERIYPSCPYCGHKPVPANRSAPEFVDGDLTELDPAVLALMRREVEAVDKSAEERREELRRDRCPEIGINANVKRHVQRQDAQTILRDAMAWWVGYQQSIGRSDAEIYRRFYYTFDRVDMVAAKALNTAEALVLAGRINDQLVGMC